jgi:hypothetical protein
MLTLAQLEIAARELCRTRGVNPDEMVECARAGPEINGSPGMRSMVLMVSYDRRWLAVASEIRAFLELQGAVDFAREQRDTA